MGSSVRRVLYLVTKGPESFRPDLLPDVASKDQDVTAVLLEDGVRLQSVPASHVYMLTDGPRPDSSKIPGISYGDLLKLMFDAHTVVTI